MIDETSCNWNFISVTNLSLSQNVAAAPKTLGIQLREAAQDNERITNMFHDAVQKYQLNRDDCSAIAFDSAAYNEAA